VRARDGTFFKDIKSGIHVTEACSIRCQRQLEITGRKLPRRAQELVLDWAELHQNELIDNWELCRQHLEPKKIEPLQ
jgi:hypothetical protein